MSVAGCWCLNLLLIFFIRLIINVGENETDGGYGFKFGAFKNNNNKILYISGCLKDDAF